MNFLRCTKSACISIGLLLAIIHVQSSTLSAKNLSGGAIFPQISSDGSQIAFSQQGAIWKVPTQGGTMARLTSESGFDIEPAWSPDGQWIALIRSINFAEGRLQLISSESGQAKELPRRINAMDRLYFSSDGKRLLGLFSKPGDGPGLRWLNLDTGELGDALLPYYSRQRYALSQDGRQIVVADSRDKQGEQSGNNGPQFTVFTMPAQGGKLEEQFEFPNRIYDLSWTDNDKALLIVTHVGGAHNDLWRIPLDAPLRNKKKLTFGQAGEDRPSVSADSRWMVYTNNSKGLTELRVRDTQTNDDRPVRATTKDFGSETDKLELSILGSASQTPVTARISVQEIDGKFYTPNDKIYRLQGANLHFYASGQTSLTLPAGKYKITAWRGAEYLKKQEVEVKAKQTTQTNITLARWIDQRSRGWFSGESHIHANYGYGHWYNSPQTMLAQLAGEDLLVSNLVVANSDSDGVFDREFFRGTADPLSNGATRLHWNQEFRSTIWGI